jgi:hypothetical protein
MRTRTWGLLLLVLLGALVGGMSAAAEPAMLATTPPPLPSSAAMLPPQLQELEQKMAHLKVNQEHFVQTEHGSVTTTLPAVGGRHRRHVTKATHRISLDGLGEVSLSPPVAEFRSAGARRPSTILIGSTAFLYVPKLWRRDHGRPWVRFKHVPVAGLFPFHGERSSEVSAGGTGPYARLINLIATATGPVSVVGAATIDGQQTTEFRAFVEPFRLLKGVAGKELEQDHLAPEDLEVFVTESGLPLRVILSQAQRMTGYSFDLVSTTEITAVGTVVAVRPPPADRTISEAEYIKLNTSTSADGSTTFTVIARPARRPAARAGAARRSKQ